MSIVLCYENESANEFDAATCDRWRYILFFVLEYNMKLVDDNLMVVTSTHIRLEICTIYRHIYLTFSATFDSFILFASTPQ